MLSHVAVHVGYDEALSHRVMAGVDVRGEKI